MRHTLRFFELFLFITCTPPLSKQVIATKEKKRKNETITLHTHNIDQSLARAALCVIIQVGSIDPYIVLHKKKKKHIYILCLIQKRKINALCVQKKKREKHKSCFLSLISYRDPRLNMSYVKYHVV